jgi:hypothetical protein
MDTVLMARKVRGEIGAVNQAHTGALREQIDDLWAAGVRRDDPIDLGRGVVRRSTIVMTISVSALARAPSRRALPGIRRDWRRFQSSKGRGTGSCIPFAGRE